MADSVELYSNASAIAVQLESPIMLELKLQSNESHRSVHTVQTATEGAIILDRCHCRIILQRSGDCSDARISQACVTQAVMQMGSVCVHLCNCRVLCALVVDKLTRLISTSCCTLVLRLFQHRPRL